MAYFYFYLSRFRVIFHFQENGNELPKNPDTNWTVVECQHGWEYDRSEFVNTLVTEVTKIKSRKLNLILNSLGCASWILCVTNNGGHQLLQLSFM